MIIGNGRLDAVEIKGPMTLADTTMPSLALQWVQQPVRGELQTVQRENATITIDADGSSSKLKVTLTIERRDFVGDALADLTYVISGAAAKSAWTSTTASGTASAATLKDVIDLINELDGFKAWALHAPHSMSVNSDNFIDLAETGIQSGTGVESASEVLYRDASDFVDGNSDYVAYLRIGLPEVRDADALKLLSIEGTSTGVTNGVLRLYQDDYSKYGETAPVYVNKALVAAQTEYVGKDRIDASTIQGPVILEVRSDDLTAAEYRVGIMQASIGA